MLMICDKTFKDILFGCKVFTIPTLKIVSYVYVYIFNSRLFRHH